MTASSHGRPNWTERSFRGHYDTVPQHTPQKHNLLRDTSLEVLCVTAGVIYVWSLTSSQDSGLSATGDRDWTAVRPTGFAVRRSRARESSPRRVRRSAPVPRTCRGDLAAPPSPVGWVKRQDGARSCHSDEGALTHRRKSIARAGGSALWRLKEHSAVGSSLDPPYAATMPRSQGPYTSSDGSMEADRSDAFT